jgi:3-methyl-2-oxobutanoate hydroxymethyltransferase
MQFPLVANSLCANGGVVPSVKITAETIRQMKGREPIAALTVYDYPMTRMLDECGVPLLLVGDSLGMVVLGLPDTTGVTMADMEHHTRAAARAQPRALLAADLPKGSYETIDDAVANSRRLIDAGAEAVKAEGGSVIQPQVEAILAAGIPFLGHIGMLPQNVKAEGGYKVKGKTEAEQEAILCDAKALDNAGAFAVVLELVAPAVAAEISKTISIATIGIGAGTECDGQILVTTDLWATSPDYIPRHVQPNMQVPIEMRRAITDWKNLINTTEAQRTQSE